MKTEDFGRVVPARSRALLPTRERQSRGARHGRRKWHGNLSDGIAYVRFTFGRIGIPAGRFQPIGKQCEQRVADLEPRGPLFPLACVESEAPGTTSSGEQTATSESPPIRPVFVPASYWMLMSPPASEAEHDHVGDADGDAGDEQHQSQKPEDLVVAVLAADERNDRGQPEAGHQPRARDVAHQHHDRYPTHCRPKARVPEATIWPFRLRRYGGSAWQLTQTSGLGSPIVIPYIRP